jgi:hypothetical protein
VVHSPVRGDDPAAHVVPASLLDATGGRHSLAVAVQEQRDQARGRVGHTSPPVVTVAVLEHRQVKQLDDFEHLPAQVLGRQPLQHILRPVLASWAPGLHKALTSLGEGDHVIADGTLIPIDRIRADEPYYSMKHRRHGMNVPVIARSDGTPPWFSRSTPGRTHDLTAARAHGIIQACLTREILVLADRAYQGAGATVRTPYYHHREQPEHHQKSTAITPG